MQKLRDPKGEDTNEAGPKTVNRRHVLGAGVGSIRPDLGGFGGLDFITAHGRASVSVSKI